MDFTLTANANGPGDPNNVTLRGADPLFALPAGHLLRRSGLHLVATPGGLIATLDNAYASEVEALLVPALRPDANLQAIGFILRPPTPQKLEVVLAQLAAEPPPHRLNTNATYSSIASLAAAILEVVSHLDPNNLSPAYTCTPADVYGSEPSAVVPAAMASLLLGTEVLTWGQLCNANGFCIQGGFVAFSCFGRCLAATRDTPNSPTREFLKEAVDWARDAGKLGSAALPFVPATALAEWLQASLVGTPPITFVYETASTGVERRLQAGRDRSLLTSGVTGQRADVLGHLAMLDPLRQRLPSIWSILGAGVSRADVRGALGQLAGAFADTAAEVSSVMQLLHLEGKCKGHLHVLTSSAMPVGALASDRVAKVCSSVARDGSSSSTGGKSKSTLSSVVAGTFSSALAAQVGLPTWRQVEAALDAELLALAPNSLKLTHLLTNSPILAARRFALGSSDEAVLELISLSPVLARAKSALDDWQSIASRALVADQATDLLPTGVTDLRLPTRVTNSLKRGAFNEIDLVEDLLRPQMAARQGVPRAEIFKDGRVPATHATEYPDGVLDADACSALDEVAVRLSTLLGILLAAPAPPLVPPPAPGVPPPPPQPPPPWISFPDLLNTVNKARLDIKAGDRNFGIQRMADLKKFVTAAWEDAAHEFQLTLKDPNPVGRLPGSFVSISGAAASDLAALQKAIIDDRTTKATNPAQAAMYGWWEANRALLETSGGLAALTRAARLYSGSASTADGTRAARGSASAADGRKSPSQDRDRERSRSRSPGRGPGSMHGTLIRHSKDGESFWFVKAGTEERVTPAYDYATLEQMSGFSRAEKCFPVLLSIKAGDAKLEVCGDHQSPAHSSMSSPAHKPIDGFIEKVRSHFRQPARP